MTIVEESLVIRQEVQIVHRIAERFDESEATIPSKDVEKPFPVGFTQRQ